MSNENGAGPSGPRSVFTLYFFNPTADDFSKFRQVFREDHMRPVGKAFRVVCDAQPKLDAFEFDVDFINQQQLACTLLGPREHSHLERFEGLGDDRKSEGVPVEFWHFAYIHMQRDNELAHFGRESARRQNSGGGGVIQDTYSNIISLKNLFTAWKEFIIGKKNKADVLEFGTMYEQELIALHASLDLGRYSHGGYHAFMVCDPKRRSINKARVRDRVLHHAIHRLLVPIFEPGFIFDSYSSRKAKGVHAARERFREFARVLSRNNTKTVWVLKCDIRKFFDSVDHAVLMGLLARRLKCPRTLALLGNIIRSYDSGAGKGIPLGNLTSQLFSNVYMDPFDQFMKRIVRAKCYIRYADDFVILSRDRDYLARLIPTINAFLDKDLKLRMHPNKVEIKKWHSGIDFLGATMFPHFRVLRTKTKRRAFRKIRKNIIFYKNGLIQYEDLVSIIRSYLGIMQHVDSFGVRRDLLSMIRSMGSAGVEFSKL
ncbi:MAG: hypothetical protein JWM20_897 [Patescibacteria group bacterium]|nr:hypothetical protein [Patescibacteria group bacterium]